MSPLLELRDLAVEFRRGWGAGNVLRAVDGVSFTVDSGETLGLVGESGSGKSTIGRAILGLTPVASGQVRFDGKDITHADKRERRRLSRDLQVIFQDPYSSLNPTRTIGSTLAEPVGVHERLSGAATRVRIEEMLAKVGMPADAARRYPAQFSGGQRQRIAIARALMLSPRLVICDEPVSSLDLSIQAQVLNLLRSLQEDLSLSYLFIAHDLAVVRYLSHRIVVLYRGKVMETGPAQVVHDQPSHPYTRALLAAAPVADPHEQHVRRQERAKFTVHSNGHLEVGGCPFRARCPFAIEKCREMPPLAVTPLGTYSACHRTAELPSWTEGSQPAAIAGRRGLGAADSAC